MLTSKFNFLKPLIKSRDGIHLTAYISNNGNILSLRRQLRETIESAKEYIGPVMNNDDLNKFLEPLQKLINDIKLLRSFKGNIGIFRTADTFRVINIPTAVNQTCVVATSFHVKPLLRWMQTDSEFLILGINENSASLYHGSQNSLNLVDTVFFPEVVDYNIDVGDYKSLKSIRNKKIKQAKALKWLSDWIVDITEISNPKLFIAGKPELVDSFNKISQYKNVSKNFDWPHFRADKISEIAAAIRILQRKELISMFDHTMVEFYQAEDLNQANKNIFNIARAAVRGKISKLIIADGVNIFGKLDRNTGGLSIHPADLDHEDDDLLDDLAQEVLARGGEVIVANREQIPKGRPILAILKPADSGLKQRGKTMYFKDEKHMRGVV
jgi:hypothetical protein